MHRLPKRAGFDIVFFEGQADVLAGEAFVLFGVYQDGGEPAVAKGAFGLGRELDVVAVVLPGGEVVLVALEIGAALGDALVQYAHLTAADAGQDVAEAVVVADLGMLIVWGGVAGLGGQEAGFLDEGFVRETKAPPPLVVMILLPLKE